MDGVSEKYENIFRTKFIYFWLENEIINETQRKYVSNFIISDQIVVAGERNFVTERVKREFRERLASLK